jgi:hypothetical protein
MTGLTSINLSGNSLSAASCGLILQAVDAAGVYSGTLDLSGNTAPDYGTDPNLSATGAAVVSLLEKNWTLTVAGTVPAWVLNKVEFTCTAGTLAIATAADEAMFFHETADLSYLAAEPDGTSNYLLEFVDDAGKKATAYAASVGGGESLGSELLSNTSHSGTSGNKVFASDGGTINGDVPDSWSVRVTTNITATLSRSIDDYFNIVSVEGLSIYRQTELSITSGSLYVFSNSVTDVVTSVSMRFCQAQGTNDQFPPIIITENGQTKKFFTASGNFSGIIGPYSSLFVDRSASFISSSVKKYLDVPSTGLRLVTTQNGSTRGMTSVESGFDSNRIVKIRFLNPNL